MAKPKGQKQLYWVGSSRESLLRYPEAVRHVMGYALYLAQIGERHPDAKPLRGFGGAGVLEIVDDRAGDAYRCVYTVRLPGTVYVLHVFKKKAKRGAKTSKHDMPLIRDRLKLAERFHCGTEWTG